MNTLSKIQKNIDKAIDFAADHYLGISGIGLAITAGNAIVMSHADFASDSVLMMGLSGVGLSVLASSAKTLQMHKENSDFKNETIHNKKDNDSNELNM